MSRVTPDSCANCGKPIWRQRGKGVWMHRATASASCYPGSGSWRKANPVEVPRAVGTPHTGDDMARAARVADDKE